MFKRISLFITLFLLCPFVIFANTSEKTSVVKIYITSQKFDQDSPWQKKSIERYYSNGCVISKNRIVTTAYPLTDHIQIEVLKPGTQKKYPARIIVKDSHNGLALLTVDDKSFFKGITPAKLMKPKKLNGSEIKITRWDASGVLKEYKAEPVKSSIRIYQPNCGVLMHLMATSMNEGGDGDPVFINKQLAGVSVGLSTKEKKLYVISSDQIRTMLKDLDDGKYDGGPFFWIIYRDLAGDVPFRSWLKIPENKTGVYVCKVPKISSGYGILKKGDVITAINGKLIDDNGMYNHPHYGKIDYLGLISLNRKVGETLKLDIIRKGKSKKIRLKLKPLIEKKLVIQQIPYDRQPNYLVLGGMVFQELSRGFMQTWGEEWPKKVTIRLYHNFTKQAMNSSKTRKRLVVLNRVLASQCNVGYEKRKSLILQEFNGTRVKDIPHLVTLAKKNTSPFIVLNFMGDIKIVLDSKEVKATNKTILKQYNIPEESYTKSP